MFVIVEIVPRIIFILYIMAVILYITAIYGHICGIGNNWTAGLPTAAAAAGTVGLIGESKNFYNFSFSGCLGLD